MTSSFREDLSNLILNNNYLLDLPNRKVNENVLVIKYSPPSTSTNPRFINTLSTNPIEYKNSLNYNANQYGINTDLKILSYLYFPDNEKNYQFRVTTNGNTSYPGEFNMYLNNYQYKIFDNTANNKRSNIDIIKKGVYLLCLEIPYHNSNFTIQYSVNSLNWENLDNLLISKFTTTLDKKTLIDSFLISGLNYCNQDNINNPNCIQFYKDIENTIVDTYLDEIQTSIYPTPIDGSYNNFMAWDINDSNYKDIETVNPLPTNRTSFKCGKSTKRYRSRSYNKPKYGGKDIFEDNIYKTESNKSNMLFKKSLGAYVQQEETKDITCYTPNEINTQWKNIGCITPAPPNNDTLKYLSYDGNFTNINTNIDQWSNSKLRETNNAELIKQCYGEDQNTGFLIVTDNRSNSKLYPGTEINNKNGTIDVRVAINYDYKLIFQKDGNLVLYDGTIESKNAKWNSGTWNKQCTKLRMQHDGNLVIYTENNKPEWTSGTNGMDTKITSAELTNKGFLVINNQNGNILKTYPEANLVENYLKTTHWDNSPKLLMMDYIGRVWRVESWAFGGFFDENNDKLVKTSAYKDTTGAMDFFKGWEHSHNNNFWTGNGISKRLNLTNINGYNNELNNWELPDRNASSNNYYTENDRETFKKGIGHYGTITDRYPEGIVSKDKSFAPNRIPGYVRISTDNYDFITMNRGASKSDLGFILFKIHYNKNEYANDIIKNHPELIKNILNGSHLTKLIKDNIGSDKDWAVPYRNNLLKDYGISTFANKSIFNNKLYTSMVENYENPQCNLENILTDSNCNSLEINIYKNYINNMNDYCTGNWVNSINPECNEYYNKSFIDTNGETKKIDVPGKLKLLEIQEKSCENDNYFINDRCIEINYSKPDIIKYQAKLCSDIKNKDLCNELNTKYTNHVKKSISANMLNDDQEVLYKNELEKEILYNTCNQNNNILMNNCNRLINDPNISEEQKNNLINRKNKLCTETNINDPICIQYNKDNPNIFNQLKNKCLETNSNDCKEFCKKNKDDEEFKKTDFYKEVCYSWVEEFWWVILLIVLAILGGGFMYFKKKNKTNTSNISNTSSNININNLSTN